jgi:ABC-type polysaccharide/polyol phosphate transport system ATPase subunit
VIAAGHDHHALAAMCDRAVQLDAGAVVRDDAADAVLA